jgi:hypothetical protein
MYQAIFALLTAVGAWLAWRSNPLYSTKATLRFVAGVGATIAAFVAAIVAVTDAVQNRPMIAQAAALAATVLVGTLAFIWVIIVLSSRRIPPLPAGAKPVYLHRAKVGWWARRLVIALVAFGIAAAVLPGDARIIVSMLGGLLAFLGVVMLFGGYIAADRMDKCLAAMEADPWIHWRYAPAQWQAWSDAETDRLANAPAQWIWRRDWKRSLWPVAAIVGGVLIFDPGGWQWKAGYLSALLLLGIIIVEVSNWSARNAPRRMRAFLMGAAPESYFGSSGVYSDGVLTEWLTVSNYLLEATIDERTPRSVALLFEVIRANSTPLRVKRYVLMPAQPDDDLARLQQLLSAACPSANVALTTLAPGGTRTAVAS